jgi:hypothetical protein
MAAESETEDREQRQEIVANRILLTPRMMFAIGGSVALFASLLYVRFSQASGRLSQDLTYDDVTYVVDAAERLRVGYSEGLVALLRDMLSNPPHSPWSTLLAMLGMAVGGFQDAAPYAANSVILVGVVLLIQYLFREASTPLLAAFWTFFLSSEFAFRSIHDFRPDLALGVATGAASFILLRGLLAECEADIVRSGGMFGVALLVKPAFFPHTLAMGFWLALIAVGLTVVGQIKEFPYRAMGKGILVCLAICGPYYVLKGPDIFEYFWSNTRGLQADLWSFENAPTWIGVAKLFLLDADYASFKLIGHHLYAAAGLLSVALPVLIVARRKREALFVILLLTCAIWSLFVIAYGRHDNEFFASTVLFVIILAALTATAHAASTSGTAAVVAPIVVFTLTAWAVGANVGLQSWYTPAEVKRGASWNEAIGESIANDLRRFTTLDQNSTRMVRAFVSVAGPVSANTLNWTAIKSGSRVSYFDLHRARTLGELEGATSDAAYVIVPGSGAAEYNRRLPAASFQEELLQQFRSRPGWREVAVRPPVARADLYVVFANMAVLDGFLPVISGNAVESVQGFLPEEGPYPKWSLPRVRWLGDRPGEVCFSRGASKSVRRGELSVRSNVNGKLFVEVEGVRVFEADLSPRAQFSEFVFTVPPSLAGQCAKVQFQPLRETSERDRLALFRRLRVSLLPRLSSGPQTDAATD